MKHVNIKAFDCADAWYKTNSLIFREGEDFEVGNGSELTLTKKLSICVEIEHPENRPLIDDNAPTDIKYVWEYALKYLWLNQEEANDDSTYTYGGRLNGSIKDFDSINQINAIVEKYVKCINDRQATMVIRLPHDVELNEPPCLSIIDTEISDNKLHLFCYFRSWDAYGGMCSNIAGLQLFNEALVKEINERGNLNITTGKLVFYSKNAHIYSRCFNLVNEMLNKKVKQ